MPLRLQELRGRLVERVLGVVGVGQTLRLAAVRVGALEERLGLGGVELGEWVLAIAEVPVESLHDQASGGLRADDVLADDRDQLGLVDRQRERHAKVVSGLAVGQQERTDRGPLGVVDHVEADPVAPDLGLEHELGNLVRCGLDALDVGDGHVAVAAVAVDVVSALLVLGDGGRRVGDGNVEVNLGQGWLRRTPPVRDGREVNGLLGDARGHLERPGADRGGRVRPPVVEVLLDCVDVDDFARGA